MTEDFSEDFVVEEESGANRSFLVIAGSLIGLFIIIAACLLGFLWLQDGGDDQSATRVAIEATNEQVLAQNALVTQTVQALTREAESEPPEETPTPRPTLAPTNTPTTNGQGASEAEAAGGESDEGAAAGGEGGEGAAAGGEGEEDAAGGGEGEDATGEGGEEGAAGGEATQEAAPPGDQTPTDPTPTLAPLPSGSGDQQLPQTGFSTVTFIFAGAALLAILIMARRLRSG